MTDEDEDIQDLLNQLDMTDDEVEEAEASGASEDVPPEEMLAELPVTNEPTGLPIGLEDPGPLPAAPTQVIVVGKRDEAEQAPAAAPQAAGLVDVGKFVENYFQAHAEVIADCRSDRAEAQQVISGLQADIEAIKASGSPQSVPRIYIEALVKAIEVKANINDTKVKMTDSGAKLIAALRSQINIQNNNQASIDGNLENILVRPLDATTDEY